MQLSESALRGRANRLGYRLVKSRVRNWRYDNQGGFRIVDPFTNFVMAGDQFDLDIDDVQDWLLD